MAREGTFSLHYPDRYGLRAVDWDYLTPRQWSRSFREYYSVRWEPCAGIDNHEYTYLLGRFGLSEWEHELPLERVIGMSPTEIMTVRREKEISLNLPRLEVKSDTCGFHVFAEEVD